MEEFLDLNENAFASVMVLCQDLVQNKMRGTAS